MWSFEGDYKAKPKQNLSGKSKAVDRQTFLVKLRNEREQREHQRRREDAAIVLQSWCRGNKIRKISFEELRTECDLWINKLSDDDNSAMDAVEKIIIILVRIYNPLKDNIRLLGICRYLIKNQNKLSQWICQAMSKWKFLVMKLVSLALKNLINLSDEASLKGHVGSHAVPLRLLEVVSYPHLWPTRLPVSQEEEFLTALFVYLLKNGYYRCLIQVILVKIPPIYISSIDAPNPIAESLILLLLQPFKIVKSLKQPEICNILYSELCNEIFNNLGQHSQLLNFILPSIAASTEVALHIEPLLQYISANLDQLSGSTATSQLLYSILTLVHSNRELKNLPSFIHFLKISGRSLELHSISSSNHDTSRKSFPDENEAMDIVDSDEETDVELMESGAEGVSSIPTGSKDNITEMCIQDLNSTDRVTWILQYVEKYINSPSMLVLFAKLFHHICVILKYKLHECRLFFSVVLKRHLLMRPMWRVLSGLQQGKILPNEEFLVNGPPGTPLLQVLSLGYPLTLEERDALVPLLSTFSASLIAVLATLHDSELLGERVYHNSKSSLSSFPFTVDELVRMSSALRDVCVGLVELAHPDMRMASYLDSSYRTMWAHCFKVCIGVVRQIHLRDTRRRFCPEGHWLSHKVFLPLKDDNVNSSFSIRPRRRYRRFEAPRWMTKDELQADGPPLSVAEQRRSTLLQEMPYVFPFDSRMSVFTTLVAADRSQHQNASIYGVGPDISIAVRRTHLYEDAFDKLSPNNEPNLRLKMRIHLLNAVGLDEAGIDGGGVFREFLSELLKTAFDPTRGFFILTRDNTLYPNPSARLIADDFEKHYYFIGRLLGKALYENLLVEIPLAGFFLSKLLSGHSNSVEFHHLDSLDPELCKNLLSLKNYEGDVQDLGIDFTVLNAELGQNTVEELIPNGSNIPVTNDNCIEYIYRMADYKLNKQIAKQCHAFKEGIYNVIEGRWLRLFDWRELQMMISGSSTPIDIDGLKSNTVYAGSYHDSHPTIQAFWRVVSQFSEIQRRQLLKFVTSCSRPPLLGFKDLYPSFCIQPSGSEDRLPSASTCMNLLKLPEYKNERTLKEKLLYAVNSNAGFELS